MNPVALGYTPGATSAALRELTGADETSVYDVDTASAIDLLSRLLVLPAAKAGPVGAERPDSWANLIYNTDGDAAMSLKGFRKDLIIEFLNEQGNVALAYKVFRCWVSEYQALPELDANANAVAIESIVLQNEGWERDESVAEPAVT